MLSFPSFLLIPFPSLASLDSAIHLHKGADGPPRQQRRRRRRRHRPSGYPVGQLTEIPPRSRRASTNRLISSPHSSRGFPVVVTTAAIATLSIEARLAARPLDRRS